MPFLTVEDLRYQHEWARFIKQQKFEYFATLNFNCYTTVRSARARFKDLLARLDSNYLGRNWCKKRNKRTLAFGFIENEFSNLHIHALIRTPPDTFTRATDLELLVERYWKLWVPAGSIDVSPITDISRLARYVTKQITRNGGGELIIVSSEFHA